MCLSRRRFVQGAGALGLLLAACTGVVPTALPAMYPGRDFVAADGLIAYGVNNADLYRRAATHVDKIVKGARPSELPVARPVRFDFAINLKTAQALGLTIPQQVLLQATEVVQ